MSFLYKEYLKPYDCFDIVKCYDYGEVSPREYYEVKQKFDLTRTNKFTDKSTTTQVWRYACYKEWTGAGSELGPRCYSVRRKFTSEEQARTFIDRLRKNEIYNGAHREVVASVGDQC